MKNMSDRAEVCRRGILTRDGAELQWFVKAPDGYLLDCGDDRERATAVADAINATRELGKEWPPVTAEPLPF